MRTMTASMMFLLSILAACGDRAAAPDMEGRNLRGSAAEGDLVFAIDTEGRRTDALMTGADFTLALAAGPVAHVFVDDGSAVRVLRFASDAQGNTQSAIPDFTGTVDLGQIEIVGAGRRSADPDTYAEPEHNPLENVDSDDDGVPDLEDEDDDDDGVDDEDDDDRDGSGDDDDDEDLDDDNDGNPNACDDDDDDDGIDDEDDDDDGDSDDDGVSDEDDVDDDNDGAEDDEEDEDETDDDDI
jgi:hypothetical protein